MCGAFRAKPADVRRSDNKTIVPLLEVNASASFFLVPQHAIISPLAHTTAGGPQEQRHQIAKCFFHASKTSVVPLHSFLSVQENQKRPFLYFASSGSLPLPLRGCQTSPKVLDATVPGRRLVPPCRRSVHRRRRHFRRKWLLSRGH